MVTQPTVADRDTGSAARQEDGWAELAAVIRVTSEGTPEGTFPTIDRWNARAEQLFGYRAEEVVGKPVSIIVPPERLDELAELVLRLREGTPVERFETTRRRKDGTDIDVSLNISPERGPDGEIVCASALIYDISEWKRRAETQSFLAEASRLLAHNVDHAQSLAEIAALTLLRIADGCTVEIVDNAGTLNQVAVAYRTPEKVDLKHEMRRLYPADANSRVVPRRVLRTGRAELIPDVSDRLLENIAEDATHLRLLRELGTRSMIVVPLRVRDRPIGTITLENGKSSRRFDGADLALAEDLAGRAALAIENSMLDASEHEARREAERSAERIGRLQAVTVALSRAVTPRAVAEVFVREGAAAVGASGGFVRLLTPGGRRLKLEASLGYQKSFRESYKSLPLDSTLPGAEVFRTGRERYFESAVAAAAAPEFTAEHEATGHEAVAFVPLLSHGHPIGVMELSFANPRTFDDDDRELLRTLADQCAQALERAWLYRAERQARTAAERAVERTSHLQTLAAELAEALTPAQVAEVAVTHGIASIGADAGALQLLVDDGKALEVVTAHGPDRSLVEGAWRRLPRTALLPSTDALSRLAPVFVESEAEIEKNYTDGVRGHPDLRARPGAHIPLVVSGRPLGVLYLGFNRPRKFSNVQRSFVLALGRQCAQALARAQLYAAESEGRSGLSRLVERLHEGVVSVDRDGRVEFANSRARTMVGPALLEQGRRVPDRWEAFPLRGFVADLLTSDRSVEAQVVSEDGERVFDVTGIPAARSDAVLLVITDVSERERRWRAEREFVDNAAHELRTPLAAITSAIERLQAGARDVPERRDRFLGHIQHESARLNRLASSLLVLARAQTREEQPRREEIRLRALLEDVSQGCELHPGVELELDCPRGTVAWTNRELLEHALVNLASNAARHTVRGRIRFGARIDGEETLTIEVEDTGAGIAPTEFDRLFDRFYRGPTEERRSGFGLGLPITKEAVEALGGRIEVESELGSGTTVRIVLPNAGGPA
ncbi:MAG TPA: GAF domain-containing protein [Gaiellaceae bacterium]|nr:GAF domain-containing protein [Gaiellaceae bacterium]